MPAEDCPICGSDNHCGNLSLTDDNKACWCMESDITFPNSLLTQVPEANKNKACICKECALKHKPYLYKSV